MQAWRKPALEKLPSLKDKIEESRNLYQFCSCLSSTVDTAYEEPRDEELLSQIFDFANWCFSQTETEEDEEMANTIANYFYRELFYGKAKRKDVHNRLSVELFEELLGYWDMSDEEWERYKRDY